MILPSISLHITFQIPIKNLWPSPVRKATIFESHLILVPPRRKSNSEKFQVFKFQVQVSKKKLKNPKTSQYFKFICKYLISNSFLTKVSSSEVRPPTSSGFNTPPASERPVVYSFDNFSLSDISEYYPPEKDWKESQFEPSVSSPSVDTAQCIQSQNLYTPINSEEAYIQVSISELELPPSSS